MSNTLLRTAITLFWFGMASRRRRTGQILSLGGALSRKKIGVMPKFNAIRVAVTSDLGPSMGVSGKPQLAQLLPGNKAVVMPFSGPVIALNHLPQFISG